jgi:pantothenate synthetase
VGAGERRGSGGGRALIAARVGSVRLLDNCDWLSGP